MLEIPPNKQTPPRTIFPHTYRLPNDPEPEDCSTDRLSFTLSKAKEFKNLEREERKKPSARGG